MEEEHSIEGWIEEGGVCVSTRGRGKGDRDVGGAKNGGRPPRQTRSFRIKINPNLAQVVKSRGVGRGPRPRGRRNDDDDDVEKTEGRWKKGSK